MPRSTQPDSFKWRHFEPVIILCAVRWYLRYSLSYRDVAELLAERGLDLAHTTVWRWIPRYAPELNRRLRCHLKPTKRSWRVAETHLCVNGRWMYLYRAIDSTGATVDFVLSAKRTADAAKRLFSRALAHSNRPQPRVINTDNHVAYPAAVAVQYLNNILEQDHRAIGASLRSSTSSLLVGAKNSRGILRTALRVLHGNRQFV